MTTRPFSLQTVLRMVPNSLLQQFFDRLGHNQLDLCWPQLKEREIHPISHYLEELSREELDRIESALRTVSDLASDRGFDALQEAASMCGLPSLGPLVPAELSVWGRTMWLWLHHPEIFGKAEIIYEVDHMSWWRKRNDLPDSEPDTSPEAIATLEGEISSLLKSQGRGKDCTVEVFRRGDTDYFFAHPDDFVRNLLVHDEDGKLSPEMFRQTLLIVFAYNRNEGTLESFARLPKATKEQLEVVFAQAILHWELAPYDPEAAYELDQLKDGSFDLTPDPADQLRIHIRKMRLSAEHTGRRVLVEVDDNDNIHKALQECINFEAVPLSEWHVTRVTFCFEFLPMDGRKQGKQTFDVSWPRSCSLRNARPERIELIQKYLKLWEIDRVSSLEPSAVALGT